MAHITLWDVATLIGAFIAGGIAGWMWARRPGTSKAEEER